jgi:hypothetical protein
MKITQKQLAKLFTAVGVDAVEIVDDDSLSDFKQDEVLQAIDASRESVIRPRIESEIKNAAVVEAKGRVGGSLERILKRTTQIPVTEFKPDMTDEEKIEVALKFREQNLGKDVQALRDEMDKIAQTHNATLDGLKADYESKLKSEKDRYTEREIIEYIAGESKEFPFPEDADRNHLAKDLLSFIKNEAHVHWNEETRKPEYRKKDAPETPLYNEAGTQIRSTRDFAELKYKPMGKNFWQTDMSSKNPAEEMAKLQTQNYQNGSATPPPGSVDQLNSNLTTFMKNQGLPVGP